MAADQEIHHLNPHFLCFLCFSQPTSSSGTGSPSPVLCSQLLAVQPGMLQQDFGMCLSAASFDLAVSLVFKENFPLVLT